MDADRLDSIPLFADLSARQRRGLSKQLSEIEIEPGERLVDEGEFAHSFFVIEEGKAAVVASGKHLTDLGPGDFLGEIGLVRKSARTASVIATAPVRALIMDEKAFRRMSRSMPTVRGRITSAIAERLERDRFFGLARE